MQDFQLVYILGVGHSGSTLLNLLLNGHSKIIGLNEIQQIRLYMGEKARDDRLESDFWQEVKQKYEITIGKPFESVRSIHWKKAPIWQMNNSNKKKKLHTDNLFSDLINWRQISSCEVQDFAEWTQKNQDLFSCIVEQSGANILIDSSKHWQRLSLLNKSGCFNIKVIHLVRDGRAVVNSYIRKFGSFDVALRRWVSRTIAPSYLRRSFESSNWLQIHYEELASQPEITLRKLCDFIEVEYEPQMLHYKQHFNPGMRGNQRVKASQEEKIILDEKWKRELSRLNQIKFSCLGGWLNTFHGY